MIKRILIYMTVTMVLGIATPAMAQDVQKAPIEQEQKAVSITTNGSTIHIKNAEDKIFEVYNVAGVKVYTIKIDSSDKTVDLNNLSKGCYILKVGKTVRKVYLN